jgi:prepilin-type N-terminal cleavage/methylation domain-containing protein
MRLARRGLRTSGFTLVEMTIAVVLLTIVVGNVYWLLTKSTAAMGSKNVAYDVDTQARRAMDRITMAIIGATEAELQMPTSKPYYTSWLNYKESKGLDSSGNNILSPLQRIELTNTQGGEVTWFENPGASGEKRVIFSKNIPQFLKDELANGIDDNANGVIDETGLSFVKNGRSITVYLTLRRTMPDGEVVTKELHETVTCRN